MQMNKIQHRSLITVAGLVILGLGLGWGVPQYFKTQKAENSSQEIVETQENLPLQTLEERFPYQIPQRTTLGAELAKLNVTPAETHSMVLAAKEIKDLSRIQPGTRFQLKFEESTEGPTNLIEAHFRFSPREELRLTLSSDQKWVAEHIQKEVRSEIVTFKGTVTSTLWQSALDAQMDARLISDLSEIFAWQVDFSREVRINDRWRLSVEKEFVEDEFVGWGSVLSAEYQNGEEVHTAILFRQDDRDLGYFSPDGSSLRRMFLKSPIEFGRISSRFTHKRFHPVLKTNRPHLGVDYAAPTGTPIRAVGDGTISFSGWSGGGGNVLKIRHNSTYETAYKHLSRFAKGIRRGSKVQQGQVIGYVGSTGLSTGPHLHFEFYVNGRFVDPLGQKFPKAEPIPQKSLAEFFEQKRVLVSYLPPWEPEASPQE